MRYKIITTVLLALLLGVGTAHAGTVDFFDRHNDDKKYSDEHHSYSKDNDWSDKDKSDWSRDDKENINHHDKDNGHNYWQNNDYDFDKHDEHISYPRKHNFDFDDDKHKDHHSPPICATADLDHHGKHHDKDGDDHRFGHKFKDYFKDICDGDRHHWHRYCDPGDPGDHTPLPGALWLFMTAMVVLAGYNKMRSTQRMK